MKSNLSSLSEKEQTNKSILILQELLKIMIIILRSRLCIFMT